MPPIELDKFGRALEQQAEDKWCSRVGIATAIKALSPLYSKPQVSIDLKIITSKNVFI